MTNLYRAEVTERVGKDGCGIWWQVGTPVTVDGTPMVRLTSGICVPAVGWSATVNEAANKAADELDRLRSALESQGEQLRQKTEVRHERTH